MKPIMLTVNRRLARTLKSTFQGRVLSWDDYLNELFETNRTTYQWRLSDLQEKVLWERAMVGFSAFGFAREQTIECARQAYALVKAYQLSPDTLIGYKEDSDLFVTAMKRFETECAELNAFSCASMIEQLIQNPVKRNLTNHLLLYGFDEWTPAQQALLKTWEDSGVRIEPVAQISRQSRVKKIVALDARDEFLQAARYAKEVVDSHQTMAIVVPQLQVEWSTIDHLLSDVFNPTFCIPGMAPTSKLYNISSGASLLEQPIIFILVETLKTLNKETMVHTWGNLLQTPFLKGGISEAAERAQFYMQLCDNESHALSITDVIHSPTIPALFKQQLTYVTQVKTTDRTCREWIVWLHAWIDAWGWTIERTMNSPEYQAVAMFQEKLPQLYLLDVLDEVHTFDKFHDVLYSLLRNTLFQTETQDKPIQVLGFLEAAGLSFDHVWITGLTADNNPAKAMPHPFIPPHIQQLHDMPHSSADRELRVAKRLLDRLIQGANDVIVSYAGHDENGEPQLESPLVASFNREECKDINAQGLSTIIANKRVFQEYEDTKGLPLTEGRLKGGSRVLREQAACPHGAYLKYRLRARAPKSAVYGISAAHQGTAIHRVLERFWASIQTHKKLISLDDHALNQEIQKHIVEVLDAWIPRLPSALQKIESRRIHDIIALWLDFEKTRDDFEVVDLERRVEVTLDDLSLSLSIDRLDRVGENQYLLIDYKTGEANVSSWEVPRMNDPQLPLYAAYTTPTPAGMVFARLKIDSIGFLPKTQALDWDARLSEFKSDIMMMIKEIKEGRADNTPKYREKTCVKCDLFSGCRLYTGGAYEG